MQSVGLVGSALFLVALHGVPSPAAALVLLCAAAAALACSYSAAFALTAAVSLVSALTFGLLFNARVIAD